MRALTRFLALSGAERRVLAASFAALAWAALAMRMQPLARVRRRLESPLTTRAGGGLPPAAISRLLDMAANRFPQPPTCLTRSVALAAILRHRGFHARLCIGVRRGGARLDAHAWVEHDGVPLNARPAVAQRYAPLR